MPVELAKYGLAGLVIFVLAGVVLYQQRRIEKLLVDKDDLQNKRLQDQVDMRDKYDKVMEAFSQNSGLLLAKLSGRRR